MRTRTLKAAAAAAAAAAASKTHTTRTTSSLSCLLGRGQQHLGRRRHQRSSTPTIQTPRSYNSSMAESIGRVPIAVLTDSYKTGHPQQYPADAVELSAYGEFRRGYDGDKEDTRLVFYGMRYIVENFVARKWTRQDVEDAKMFYATHQAPANTAYPFPADLFDAIVDECNGFFPITLEALPEGTCIHPHTPVFQISAKGKFKGLVTFLETLLVQVWYPTTVATLSRRCRDLIESAFDRSVDDAMRVLIPSRLHDFGFRGCTCVEQSVIGGCAHLLNFEGSDTMSAAYYAQFVLNGGKPVASSIPATEHSVMMSHPNEQAAIRCMISKYGKGLFACVMDSFDYARALGEVLPSIASEKVAAGGFMVLRPDSGDPVTAVLMALRAAEKVFGCTTNGKGFKVVTGAGVIQGDGINMASLARILDAVMDAGYSAENVAFGMGGGLLQVCPIHPPLSTLSRTTRILPCTPPPLSSHRTTESQYHSSCARILPTIRSFCCLRFPCTSLHVLARKRLTLPLCSLSLFPLFVSLLLIYIYTGNIAPESRHDVLCDQTVVHAHERWGGARCDEGPQGRPPQDKPTGEARRAKERDGWRAHRTPQAASPGRGRRHRRQPSLRASPRRRARGRGRRGEGRGKHA